MGDAKKSKRIEAEVAVRQTAALKLMMDRVSYDDIAERLGYADRSGARKAVMSALNRLKAERLELAEAVMDMQLARYERLLEYALRALDDADEGKEMGRAQLISAARGVLDSISRLYGLDKPSAVVTVKSEAGLNADLARLAQFIGEEPAGNGDDD